MTELTLLGANQIAKAILNKEVSSVEVLKAHINKINDLNSDLNAIVTLNIDNALLNAQKADEDIADGKNVGFLHGVPITIKDSLETAGIRSTCSCKDFANYVPKADATVVKRLVDAGAIIIGKSNLPTTSGDIQTNSSMFGRANNPWNLNYTTGGSTGGGAAAVATGLSALDIGSDLFGSIRLPAHFCGVYALRPTENRVSTAGLLLAEPGKKQGLRHQCVVGPLARSVEDLRLSLSLIQGRDPRQPSIPPVIEEYDKKSLESYRIAWTKEIGNIPVTSDTAELIEKSAFDLTQSGFDLEQIASNSFDIENILELCGDLLGNEMASEQNIFTRFFFGIMLGNRPVKESFFRGMLKATTWKSIKRYREMLNLRDIYTINIEKLFLEYDVLICPVAPGPAFKHQNAPHPMLGKPLMVDEKKLPYWLWGISYTAPFSLTGNPVVVVPIGISTTGLPIAIQIIGRRWQDMKTLHIADLISKFLTPTMYPSLLGVAG